MLKIIGFIIGFVKFYNHVSWLIGLLRDTPEDKRDDLMKKIRDESEEFRRTGRPEW